MRDLKSRFESIIKDLTKVVETYEELYSKESLTKRELDRIIEVNTYAGLVLTQENLISEALKYIDDSGEYKDED